MEGTWEGRFDVVGDVIKSENSSSSSIVGWDGGAMKDDGVEERLFGRDPRETTLFCNVVGVRDRFAGGGGGGRNPGVDVDERGVGIGVEDLGGPGKTNVSASFGGGMGGGTEDDPGREGAGEVKKSVNDVEDMDEDPRDATDGGVDALKLGALLNVGIDGRGCNCLSGLTGLPASAGVSKMEKGSSSAGAATLAGVVRLAKGGRG